MKQFSYTITCPAGLHVRPTNALAREASRFSSAVSICRDGSIVHLSDMKGILALRIRCGDSVRVMVEGRDEEAAVAAIQNYFVSNL